MNYAAAAGKSYSGAISFDVSPGRLVFVSGQLGVGAGEASQRFEDEARACFDSVSAVLPRAPAYSSWRLTWHVRRDDPEVLR